MRASKQESAQHATHNTCSSCPAHPRRARLPPPNPPTRRRHTHHRQPAAPRAAGRRCTGEVAAQLRTTPSTKSGRCNARVACGSARGRFMGERNAQGGIFRVFQLQHLVLKRASLWHFKSHATNSLVFACTRFCSTRVPARPLANPIARYVLEYPLVLPHTRDGPARLRPWTRPARTACTRRRRCRRVARTAGAPPRQPGFMQARAELDTPGSVRTTTRDGRLD